MLPNLILTDELRVALEDEREESGVSMSEQMRQVLCDHYGLDCEPVNYFGGTQPNFGKSFTLRVSPELFQHLQAEKRDKGLPMRRLVLAILNEHYDTNGGPPK